MAKTKVLKAPWTEDGSLLHFPGDGMHFSHLESDAGERLEASDVWEEIPASVDDYGRWVRPIRVQKRDDWHAVNHEPVWRDNLPFHATLQLDHMLRGRSAKYVVFRPVAMPLDRRTFPMFVADLLDVFRTGQVQPGGIISSRWMVAKRGENYGLRLAKTEE